MLLTAGIRTIANTQTLHTLFTLLRKRTEFNLQATKGEDSTNLKFSYSLHLKIPHQSNRQSQDYDICENVDNTVFVKYTPEKKNRADRVYLHSYDVGSTSINADSRLLSPKR